MPVPWILWVRVQQAGDFSLNAHGFSGFLIPGLKHFESWMLMKEGEHTLLRIPVILLMVQKSQTTT